MKRIKNAIINPIKNKCNNIDYENSIGNYEKERSRFIKTKKIKKAKNKSFIYIIIIISFLFILILSTIIIIAIIIHQFISCAYLNNLLLMRVYLES